MADPGFVSTGSLPPQSRVRSLVLDAHDRFRGETGGQCSTVYPALAEADPSLFGICVTTVGGDVHIAGDATVPFTLMSVAKPFVLALACEAVGHEALRERIGVNATGQPFNSLEAVERGDGGRTNPMVNAGAIATTASVPGDGVEEKWAHVLDGLSRFAGRPLTLDEEVYHSAIASNHRNRGIANLLHSLGTIPGDPDEAVEVYTRQSALSVDVRDLAALGATLANGGTNPVTGDRVVEAAVCHDVMAVMATAGMYETSGDWLWNVGLPGKSGISGAIVTSSPGKGGLGVFAPPLDEAGNSVKGQVVSEHLSKELGLDVFANAPR